MPWSPWQDQLVGSMQANPIHSYGWSGSNGYLEVELVPSWNGIVTSAQGEGSDWIDSAVQFNAPASYTTARNWFPFPSDWVEGVDYDIIPGKDWRTDDDAYVEYEPGENTLTGWTTPTISGKGTWNASQWAAVVFEARWAHTAHAVGQAPEPFGGTAFATITEPNASPVVLGPMPQPGAVTSFSVGLFGAGYENLDPLANDPNADLRFASIPRVQYITPRWRYWIPGPAVPLPLRQRQRDDGLALAPLRQRGRTSRQGTIRQRGYY